MRGTRNKNRQQVQDAIQKLNARIQVGGSLGTASGSIQTTAENLIPALQLVAELLKEPAFPEADFEQIRQQQITAIERGRTEPEAVAAQAIQANLSPFPRSDVRHVRTIDERIEDLKKVTLDDVKQYYSQFYGASQGDLIVVGPVKADEVQKAVSDLFGTWKSRSPFVHIDTKYLPVTPINTKIETPDKENAQFFAGLRIQMRDTDPDYAAMVMANYIMGGDIASRWSDRIRNKEGLSYDVRSSFSAPTFGDAALLQGSIISNPKNSPKAEASFRDELKKTLAEGFTQKELDAAKTAFHDARVLGRSGDAQILSLIGVRSDQDRTLDWDVQMDAKLAALTLDQVNAAFRKHVSNEISIVQAGDFKKAGVFQ